MATGVAALIFGIVAFAVVKVTEVTLAACHR
jgi:hypothetical protein